MFRKSFVFLSVMSFCLAIVFLLDGFSVSFFDENNNRAVSAAASDNVSGYAWSENIGWISFNNLSAGGEQNYGVDINPSNGKFSGFAWSENIGWIKFDPSGPYPGAPNQEARLDFNTNQVTGWVRACAGTVNGDCSSASRTDGWDGWIKMSGPGYGVTRSGCQLQGFAWGPDVVGWISFKGIGYGAILAAEVCQNSVPSVASVSVFQPNYCYFSPTATVSWVFSDANPGDSQSAYRVQVSSNPGFGTPEADSGKVSSPSTSYAVPIGRLSYDEAYYTRVMVWDSQDIASAWTDGPSFATPRHQYPSVNFTWSPSSPAQGENVQFNDASSAFGGATIQTRSWAFTDGNPATSVIANPVVQFTSRGQKAATLTVTDSDGFSCPLSQNVGIQFRLPRWREVLPW
jgi:hypothetical protein